MSNNKKSSGDLSGALGMLIALGALYISWVNYHSLLPIHEARVIIPEAGIKIAADFHVCLEEWGGRELSCYEGVNPLLKNIGEAPARNVALEFWGCFFDDGLKFRGAKWPTSFTNLDQSCIKYFNPDDTRIMHDLPPGGEAAHFGEAYVPYLHENDSYPTEIYVGSTGKPFVLIFFLEYEDSLTKKKKQATYFYKYTIGQGLASFGGKEIRSSVTHLIRKDYEKLFARLLSESEEDGSTKELVERLVRK